MPEEIGTVSLEDAFAAALDEGQATPDPVEVDGQSPSIERPDAAVEHAPDAAEQSETDTTDPTVAAMLEARPAESAEADNMVDVGSDEFYDTLIPLGDDGEVVTLSELVDSGMRHRDYTQKTQALADARRGLEEAEQFYQQWQDDPKGFATSIATQLGLIDESEVPPGELPDFVKVPTAERLSQMVEDRAEELLEADPRISQYEINDARDQVNGAFDGFEQQYEMSIPPELRYSILEEAIDRGISQVDGLELVFRARLAEAQAKQNRTQQQKRTAPSRPGVIGAPADEQPTDRVDSIEDAWNLASAELEGL